MKKLLLTGLMSVGFVLMASREEQFSKLFPEVPKEQIPLMLYVDFVNSKGRGNHNDIYTQFPSLLKVMLFLKRPTISCSYINSLSDDDFTALKARCRRGFSCSCCPKHMERLINDELALLRERMDKCRAFKSAC